MLMFFLASGLEELVALSVYHTLHFADGAHKTRLTRKEGSSRPRKTSSQTDHLIVRLAKADPTLSLTEMASVVYCSVSPSTVRRRLIGSNFRSLTGPNNVELTEKHVRTRLKTQADATLLLETAMVVSRTKRL